jgi:hypothetical protein
MQKQKNPILAPWDLILQWWISDRKKIVDDHLTNIPTTFGSNWPVVSEKKI